jgi:hypothetical protein
MAYYALLIFIETVTIRPVMGEYWSMTGTVSYYYRLIINLYMPSYRFPFHFILFHYYVSFLYFLLTTYPAFHPIYALLGYVSPYH